MKKYIIAFFIFFSSAVFATETCGKGKIVSLYGGGWNSDDLIIKIEGDRNSSVPYHDQGTIRFSASELSGRIDFLRSIALSSFIAGRSVVAKSHNDDCRQATEIAMSK